MALVRYQPLNLLNEFECGINSLFDDFYGRDNVTNSDDCFWSPSFDIVENDREFELIADVPGLKKEDINVSINDGRLEISGEKVREKVEKDKKVHRIERCSGKFKRTFILPESVEPSKVEAAYKEGVLTLKLVKSEKALPKKIEVKVN